MKDNHSFPNRRPSLITMAATFVAICLATGFAYAKQTTNLMDDARQATSVETTNLTDGNQQTTSITEKGQRPGGERTVLKNWEAGKTISSLTLRGYDLNKCFMSEPIPDRVFERMQGKSYKKGCTVSRESLRYVKVLHWNDKGKICLGELVCHKSIANDLVEIFETLFAKKYPIERMVLIDNYDADDLKSMEANNTSCFNFRYVAGTKVPSNHSYGKAIDLNPLYNPYVRKGANGKITVSPLSARQYADRSKDFKYKIDRNDLAYKEFRKRGFTWGGGWKRSQDYQHFEKK